LHSKLWAETAFERPNSKTAAIVNERGRILAEEVDHPGVKRRRHEPVVRLDTAAERTPVEPAPAATIAALLSFQGHRQEGPARR